MQAQSSTNKTPEPITYFSKLAETRFSSWVENEYTIQWKNDPPRPLDLGLVGWLHNLIEHRVAGTRVLLSKRIDLYGNTALEYGHFEMVSEIHLENLREQCFLVMNCDTSSTKEEITRWCRAVGTVSLVVEEALHRQIETIFTVMCTGVINLGIADLAAEEAARQYMLASTESSTAELPLEVVQPRQEALDDAGTVDSDTPADVPVRADDSALFRKCDEFWELSFGGKSVHCKHVVGFDYIAELLRRPGVPIEAVELVTGLGQEPVDHPGGEHERSLNLTATMPGLEITDAKAVKAVKAELARKKKDLSKTPEDEWAPDANGHRSVAGVNNNKRPVA